MTAFDESVRQRLDAIRGAHLFREERCVEGPLGAFVEVDGQRVLCFSSNDYLGLADHPVLRDAAARGAVEYGVGSGGSRLIVGTHAVHRRAEGKLAEFVGAEDAVLFSTGYAANVGALQALVGPGDVVFSDALNHASLIDGCRACRARIEVFPHADMEALRARMAEERHQYRTALILSDAVFSMDGDVAPLRELRAVADQYEAGLLIDEAHSLGVLGVEGKGACEEARIRPDVLVGTLGKAFGAQGAFVAGTRALTDLLRNRARSYVFSTAPMPLIASVIEEAVDLVRNAGDRRARLRSHADRFRDQLQLPVGTTPILPIPLGDPERTMRASAALLARGIWVHGVRPPTVPEGTSRLRLVASAAHSEEDVTRACREISAEISGEIAAIS